MNALDSKLNKMLTQLDGLIAHGLALNSIYEQIGFNVASLKEKGVDQCFGIFQSSVLNNLAIKLYNIFDTDENYDIVSIPKILKELKTTQYQLINKDGFNQTLIDEFNISILLGKEDYIIECIRQISIQRPTFKNDQRLKRIYHVRNNHLAHINVQEIQMYNSNSLDLITLPSLQDVYDLLNWADNFRVLIYTGFFPGIVYPDCQEWAEEHSQSVADLICRVIGESKYKRPK